MSRDNPTPDEMARVLATPRAQRLRRNLLTAALIMGEQLMEEMGLIDVPADDAAAPATFKGTQVPVSALRDFVNAIGPVAANATDPSGIHNDYERFFAQYPSVDEKVFVQVMLILTISMAHLTQAFAAVRAAPAGKAPPDSFPH